MLPIKLLLIIYLLYLIAVCRGWVLTRFWQAENAVTPSLYLDTARLGQMASRARRAVQSFTELVGSEPCSSRFDDFLIEGFGAYPCSMQHRYRGLSDWTGISGLKKSLRKLADAPENCPTFLASRSALLMKLASRHLLSRCKKALLTDLEWPAYQETLRAEAKRAGREVVIVALREAIFSHCYSAKEVINLLVESYQEEGCDGLFLSSVNFEGVRLPIREVVETLSISKRSAFVVVDGAQGFSHVPAELDAGYCDLYLAGCHKWLRAYDPLAVAFACRKDSATSVKSTLKTMIESGQLDDPLLRFVEKREQGIREQYSETVSLCPLFSAAGAAAQLIEKWETVNERFSRLIQKASDLARAAFGTGWTPIRLDPAMRSGIVLLRPGTSKLKATNADELRRSLQTQGLSLTCDDNRILRLSSPIGQLGSKETEKVQRALQSCNRHAVRSIATVSTRYKMREVAIAPHLALSV